MKNLLIFVLLICVFAATADITFYTDQTLFESTYPGLTVEDVQSVTEPELIVSPDLKEIEF